MNRYDKAVVKIKDNFAQKRLVKASMCECGAQAIDKFRGSFVCRDCMFADEVPLNMITWLASIETEGNLADVRHPMTHYEVTNSMFGQMVKRRPY